MSNSDFSLHPQLAADTILLGDLPLSRLLLINDSQFPWCVLVPRRNEIKEIYQLAEKDQIQLWQESASLSRAMMEIYQGDKLNVAAIGNLVPQLHLHHVVRYTHDLCWPAPIWGKLARVAYQPNVVREAREKLAQQLPELQIAAGENH